MRIKGQPDIQIYVSDGGYICLKQKSESEAEEQLIEIAPAFGTKIAGAIGSLQDFAQAKFDKAVIEE